MRDFAGSRSTTGSSHEHAAVPSPTPGKRTVPEVLPAAPANAPVQRSASGSASLVAMPDGPRPTIEDLFRGSVQLRAMLGDAGAENTAAIHASAQRGIATSASPLPHAETIQRSFGRHDISGIQAHTGADAAASARAMGAHAFATGNHVVLGAGTDLHTAAHEAAHVVQQRAGVHLKGGVGEAGDRHEQHADAVADRVVRGESSEQLLDELAGPGAGHPVIQRKVGLEIEISGFQLARGVVDPQEAKEAKGKGKEPETTPLLDGQRPGGSTSQRPADPVNEQFKKGKPIYPGDGWNLTADIIDGTPVVEFITDAPDETKDPERLPEIVGDIETYVNTNMATMSEGGRKQLADNTVLTRVPENIDGNIHITGGIRPDRIIQLLEEMSRWEGPDRHTDVDSDSDPDFWLRSDSDSDSNDKGKARDPGPEPAKEEREDGDLAVDEGSRELLAGPSRLPRR
jgi:hypothetical protein